MKNYEGWLARDHNSTICTLIKGDKRIKFNGDQTAKKKKMPIKKDVSCR
jgi:hypothetical protein